MGRNGEHDVATRRFISSPAGCLDSEKPPVQIMAEGGQTMVVGGDIYPVGSCEGMGELVCATCDIRVR